MRSYSARNNHHLDLGNKEEERKVSYQDDIDFLDLTESDNDEDVSDFIPDLPLLLISLTLIFFLLLLVHIDFFQIDLSPPGISSLLVGIWHRVLTYLISEI